MGPALEMFTEKGVVVLCREVGDRSRVYIRPLININKRAYLTVRDDWYVWLGVDDTSRRSRNLPLVANICPNFV